MDYPYNPNNSMCSTAGIISSDGRHFAFMPHPERSFLKLKIIKTTNQSMSQERLNHYMILGTYKEQMDNIDLKKLAKEFVIRKPKRENIFQIPKL